MYPEALETTFQVNKPMVAIVNHLYGVSTKIDKIKSIFKINDTSLIEDAVESLETKVKGE